MPFQPYTRQISTTKNCFMKRTFYVIPVLFLAFVLLQVKVSAQQSVGIGTTTPDPSSILDITSINKGVLLPRVTTAQKNAIAAPATGLLVYQTDSVPGFYYYLSGWQLLNFPAANISLSNLADPTAINQHLLPEANGTKDLGSLTNGWNGLYINADMYLSGLRLITSRGSNTFFGMNGGNTGITGSYNTGTGTEALKKSASLSGAFPIQLVRH